MTFPALLCLVAPLGEGTASRGRKWVATSPRGWYLERTGGHFTWDDGELSRQSTAELLASPDFPHHCSDQLVPQVEETRKFLSLLLLLKPDQSLKAFVGPSGDSLHNLK